VTTGGAASITLQLYKTLIMSSCNYLLCLMEPSKEVCDWVDGMSKRIARHVLAMPDFALNATVLGAAGLLPFAAICARDRVRFCRKMLQGPLASPIAREVFLISNEVALGMAPEVWPGYGAGALARPRFKPTAEDLYYYNTAHMCATWEASYGMPSLIPAGTGQHSSPDPQAYARALSQKLWQREWLAGHIWKDQGVQYSATAVSEELVRRAILEADIGRPLAPDSASCAAMAHNYFHSALTAEDWQLPHTLLSMVGPGCSGNILVLPQLKTSRLQMAAMMAGRLGRMGLAIPPFRPVDALPEDPLAVADPARVNYAAFHHRAVCRRCGGEPEDAFHALVECQHPRVVAARAAAIAALPKALLSMAEAAMVAAQAPPAGEARQQPGAAQPMPAQRQPEERPTPVRLLRRLAALLQQSIDSGDWAEPLPIPHAYLLYMLLIAQPWPAFMAKVMAADEHQTPSLLLLSLSHIFDNIYAIPYRTRPLASAWVKWAGTASYSIAVAWGDPTTATHAKAQPAPLPRARRLPTALRTPHLFAPPAPSSTTIAGSSQLRQAHLPEFGFELRRSAHILLSPDEDEEAVLLPPQPPPTDLFGL
jgi:hypothetical protein